jgi:hypothetical protein
MNLLRGGFARDIYGKPSNCKERRNRVVVEKISGGVLPKLRKLRDIKIAHWLSCRTQREIFLDTNRHNDLILIDTELRGCFGL